MWLKEHLDPRGILRFQRCLPLERGGLVPGEFDVGAAMQERIALHPIDKPSNIKQHYKLASGAASKQVSLEDFTGWLSDLHARVRTLARSARSPWDAKWQLTRKAIDTSIADPSEMQRRLGEHLAATAHAVWPKGERRSAVARSVSQ